MQTKRDEGKIGSSKDESVRAGKHEADLPGLARIATMVSHSSRILRATANRVDDQRLAVRLRRIANRELRASRIIERMSGRADAPGEVPGIEHLSALASPDRGSLFTACVDHARVVLHELNDQLDSDRRGPTRRRRLARLRDVLERDAARLRTLLRRRTGPTEPIRRKAAPGVAQSKP